MANKWDKEKEILKKLILTDKLSYEEIGRKYGCTGSNIKKVAQKIGIILYSKRKINPEDILKEQGGVCAICGIEPVWNDKELVFIIDHIDGHASNNKRENLRCVCPNCDSQLDTYKSKNKCGERSYYRYHKEEEISI